MARTGEAKITLLDDFSQAQRERLLVVMTRRRVRRGDTLFLAGDDATVLYVVCHGNFAAEGESAAKRGRIGAGEVIGDAGFFARLPHSYTVRACRDGEVLGLSRKDWEILRTQDPQIAEGFLAMIARRLHKSGTTVPVETVNSRSRVLAIVPPPDSRVPAAFFARLGKVLERAGATLLDRGALSRRFGAISPDDSSVVAWLNSQERTGGTIVYFTDGELTEWTRRCIRQADQVMLVRSAGEPPAALSEVEHHVVDFHPPEARRLVLVHPKRSGVVSGTRGWLARYEVGLHHHISLEDDLDLESLSRFITGTAVGFVAGGGGGFGPAHVGVFRAFSEAGVTFDAYVGTSVGAAMVAGFSFLYDADQLEDGTHDIFVASRSFKRPTWPRYALLDHKVFDEALQRAYGPDTMIEDCWRPFRAVATNLTQRSAEAIETGHLWKAVRASSAIPCVLPPFINGDGTVYVDGGVMDDAPLAPMKALKDGPNVVVHFGKTGEQRFNASYDDIPGRFELVQKLLNPFATLPRGPRPLGMLFRTMLAHQNYNLPVGENDLALTPPAPRGASVMNFDNHLAVSDTAYQWTSRRIEELRASGDAALASILPQIHEEMLEEQADVA